MVLQLLPSKLLKYQLLLNVLDFLELRTDALVEAAAHSGVQALQIVLQQPRLSSLKFGELPLGAQRLWNHVKLLDVLFPANLPLIFIDLLLVELVHTSEQPAGLGA